MKQGRRREAHGKAGAIPLRDAAERIAPDPLPLSSWEEESPDVWGFRDSGFTVNARGCVEARGDRYALGGCELPDLLPWMRRTLDADLDINDPTASHYPAEIPQPQVDPEVRKALVAALGAENVAEDDALRLRHGHGHSQEEMYAIKYGRVERVPDLVVQPVSRDAVEKLVRLAAERGLCLIPYGGGTNVSCALRCPPAEPRIIVSVDMRRMNQIEWIDVANRAASIQAGAVGRHIQAALARHGFTAGHEPDSVEFSTLGGWIATRASGMKKNRYGNIEELLLDVEAVTPRGLLPYRGIHPRESVGPTPREWLLGSEGTLAIITRAVVKVFPLPPLQRYGSIVFPDFPTGVAFLRALTQAENIPASVRLVDNLQFQFSQALRPARRGAARLRSRLERAYVTGWRGMDPEQMVACTLVFEGSAAAVRIQERAVYALGRDYGGLPAGSQNGERGYQLTFGIAYLRDFAMRYYILGESFETSVPWDQLLDLCTRVKRRVWHEHAKRGLPGKPFVTCRVTQLYDSGACVYFYFAFYHKGVEQPSAVYAEIERCARDEILRSGGSLSHHHGVGKLRQGFLPEIFSPTALAWRRDLKESLDPQNVFGCANQGL